MRRRLPWVFVFMTVTAIVALAQTRRPVPAPLDEAKMLAGFNITVARTETGVSLTCAKGGCAWRTLRWTVKANDVAVAINEYGMANKK